MNVLLYMFQLRVCPKSVCISTVGVRKDLFKRNPDQVPITDFFGSVRPVELIRELVNVEPLIDGVEITNTSKSSKVDDTASNKVKPKKFRYVPHLVNFNMLIS